MTLILPLALFFFNPTPASHPADTIYLNLSQTLKIALKKSPAALEASASRLQSGISLGQGIGNILPTPEASLIRLGTESGTIWSGKITITQILIDPYAFAGFVSAIVNCGYHSLDAREKTARLIYDVTTEYLNLLKTQLMLNAAQKALTQADENWQLTTERFRLGQVTRLDLLRSEAFYSQTKLNLLSAERTIAIARANFCASAGIDPNKTVWVQEELVEPAEIPIHDPDSLLQMMESSNPGVRMAGNLKTVAIINLAASLCRILPGISLYRSYEYSDTALPRSLRNYQEKISRTDGIRLSFPIVDIKTFILNIGDALTGSRRTRAALARARVQLRAAAQAAILGYEEAKQRYWQAKHNLKLNRELYELASTQHRLGTLALTDLLEAEAGLAQAEASYLSALCDTYIQAAQIGYLLGRNSLK
ncbi:MAG: TolC family protein [bacterium]